jgi:hypothetical protein
MKTTLSVLFVFSVFWGYAQKTKSEEIKIPFEDNQYKSNATHFRAKQSGLSPRQDIAKKIALVNAKAELVRNIESTLKSVTEIYNQQVQVGEKIDINSNYEEVIREVSKQTLSDVKLIGEKSFIDQNTKLYTTWVVIEVAAESIIEKLNEPQQQLKIDKKRFEKLFEEEMKNL